MNVPASSSSPPPRYSNLPHIFPKFEPLLFLSVYFSSVSLRYVPVALIPLVHSGSKEIGRRGEEGRGMGARRNQEKVQRQGGSRRGWGGNDSGDGVGEHGGGVSKSR